MTLDDVKIKQFDSWNLPDILQDASDWIRDNEINVCDMTISAYDDADHPICSTIWRVEVSYIDD